VVGDLVLHDTYVVAISLPEKRDTAFGRLCLLQGPHDLVVTRRIERHGRTTRLDRSEDRNAPITLLLPSLVFLPVLEIWADRNRNRQDAEARPLSRQPPKAARR